MSATTYPAQSQAGLARQRVWQLVLLTLLCLPAVLAGVYVWQKHQWATQRLAELEPRHARLQGLLIREAEFQQASTQAGEQIRRHAYAVSVDANLAGTEAQQRIREVFAGSGLTVSSLQVLPAKEDGPFDRIPVALAVEGELFQLQAALLALGALQPTVLVDAVALRPTGLAPPSSSPRLGGQFRLSVLRERN